jgi:thiol reductant ABC exporter CydD subunit
MSPGGNPDGPVLSAHAHRDVRASVVLGTLGVLLVIAQAWTMASVVDRVFLRGAGLADLAGAIATLVALAFGRAALAWSADVRAQRAAARAKLDARRQATAALLARGPLDASRGQTGDVVHLLSSGLDALDGYVAQYLPQARLASVGPGLVLVAVLWADALSALVLAITFPLIPLFMVLIGGAARERTRRQWVTLARMSARFLDAVQGLPTLKAFGRTADEVATLTDRTERFRTLTMEVLKLAFVSSLALELLATIGTAIVAVEVGLRLLYAKLALQPALFVLMLAPEFYRPLRALGSAYHASMAGREVSERLAEFIGPGGPIAVTPARQRRNGPAEASAPQDLDVRGPLTVVFEAVSCTYAGRHEPALENASFTLRPGSTVALVGPSGSGKSTCANLLLRFVEPSAGAIRVNGVDIGSLPATRWRHLVAWVPQRPHLFHGTVRENLLLGRTRTTTAEGDLWQALEQAAARRFVEALPQGLDTPIGERAARLSGGQAQRLAIARAMLADAPLVVLDEPTSQLDPWTEPEIQAAIARLRAGRTVLLIAHRFSMVRRADQVVLLSSGRVEAFGAPADLLASHPWFRRMAGRSAEVAR